MSFEKINYCVLLLTRHALTYGDLHGTHPNTF